MKYNRCRCGKFIIWYHYWCSDECAKKEFKELRKRLTHINTHIDALPSTERMYAEEKELITNKLDYIKANGVGD